LASFDGNADGWIDDQDDVFAELQIWRDANQDGVTDQGELGSLAEYGIAGIDLGAYFHDSVLDNDVITTARGRVVNQDGSERTFHEVGFVMTEVDQNASGTTYRGMLGDVAATTSNGATNGAAASSEQGATETVVVDPLPEVDLTPPPDPQNPAGL
jgi:hypothetical protein